jgi:hypothetical protein
VGITDDRRHTVQRCSPAARQPPPRREAAREPPATRVAAGCTRW